MDHDELLRDEYLSLRTSLDAFDEKALTIKAWSVTLSGAGLGLAYSEGEPSVLLIAAASALVFWLIEALWKAVQRGHLPRMEEIEAHFSSACKTVPFQVGRARKKHFTDRRLSARALDVIFWPHIMLPHAVIAAGGIILFAVAPPASSTDETTTPPQSAGRQ